MWVIESNFQLNVQRNPGLLCFCFTSFCDWSRKLAPLSQPIRFKTLIKRDLVIRVLPRFKQFACFPTSSSLWLLVLFSFI